MSILMALAAVAATPSQSERLTRIADANDKGELNPDATMGQVAVGYYIELQTKYPKNLQLLNDQFVCKDSVPQLLKAVASKKAHGLSADVKQKLAANDPGALESFAIDVIGEMDGADPAKIRADETIGPGVYRPAITAVAYTIGRCKFYR